MLAFTLAAGDTQDVVEAVVGGLGDNQLSSITDMKFTDQVAQALFDDLFQSAPSAPSAPKVSVTTEKVLPMGGGFRSDLCYRR